MSPRLRSYATACALMGALLACGSDDEPPRAPGLSAQDQAKLPTLPPAPTEPAAPAAKAPTFADIPSSIAPGQAPAGSAEGAPGNAAQGGPAGAEGVPADKKKRDLSAELQTALGQPTDCLDLQKVVDDGGKIKIRVAAYVGPSGRVTRATVMAPGQPAQALSCIERRAVAVKMQDPIEDAPRVVDAELSFEIARNQALNVPPAVPPAPSPPPSY